VREQSGSCAESGLAQHRAQSGTTNSGSQGWQPGQPLHVEAPLPPITPSGAQSPPAGCDFCMQWWSSHVRRAAAAQMTTTPSRDCFMVTIRYLLPHCAPALRSRALAEHDAWHECTEILVRLASGRHLLRGVRAAILLRCSRVLAVAAQASTHLNARCRTHGQLLALASLTGVRLMAHQIAQEPGTGCARQRCKRRRGRGCRVGQGGSRGQGHSRCCSLTVRSPLRLASGPALGTPAWLCGCRWCCLPCFALLRPVVRQAAPLLSTRERAVWTKRYKC